MAVPHNIDTDLTLEIEGRAITPEKFLRGVRAFFAILNAVTKDTVGEAEPVRWLVKVKAGSHLVGVQSVPGSAGATVALIADRVRNGIRTLEERAEEPTDFPVPAARALRDLGRIVGVDETDDTRVRVWTKRDATGVTHKSVAHVAELFKGETEDYGSIEGRLQMISERGTPHFAVYEPVWDKAIRCYLDEEPLQDALGLFGKRVEVYGHIKYDRHGRPISIKVDEITGFPVTNELPTFREVRGILREQ